MMTVTALGYFTKFDTKWRWVVKFTPRPLYPRGKNPDNYSIGSCVGLSVGLVVLEKIKMVSTSNRTPIRPAVPVVIPTVPNRLRSNNNNNNNNNNNKEPENLSKY